MNSTDRFIDKLNVLIPDLVPCAANKMAEYFSALMEINKNINLTAITDPEEAAEKHFFNSIAAADYIPSRAHIIDVGTGGGFPGIPIKIIRPDIKLTVLDATGKKVEAVRKLCDLTHIDAEAVCMRAEDAGRGKYRGQFDVVLSRAVASLPVLAELCIPLARKGGIFIAYKSSDAEDIRSMTFLEPLCAEHAATAGGGDKKLLIFRKKETTPNIYPRPFAKIKKHPL